MTLADELRGVTPHVTLRGVVVSNDDPIEETDEPEDRIAIMRERFDRAEFTHREVGELFGLNFKGSAAYVGRLAANGTIASWGLAPGRGGRRLKLWKFA